MPTTATVLNKKYVLSEIKKLTTTVSSFIFKSQDGASIDFTPGMFAMLMYKGDEGSVSRAFSIANPPPSDSLEFMIALIHGSLTSKLEKAKVGDVYYISAPYGQFKFDSDIAKKLLFLAGGTGLAPFMSMLRLMRKNGLKADCKLIYSVKHPDEIIAKKELESMAEDIGLEASVTVTRPVEGGNWGGLTGHINAEMIKKCASDCTERVSYICGPPAFVKALKDALLSLGVNEKEIHAEMWGE